MNYEKSNTIEEFRNNLEKGKIRDINISFRKGEGISPKNPLKITLL